MEKKELSSAAYQAETMRAQGDLIGALVAARSHGALEIDQLPTMPKEQMVDVIRLWRIWATVLSSLYRQTPDGQEAARYLEQERDVLRTYYYHPSSWETAKTITHDPQGNEYFMAAEMCRDEGKYYLHVAELTGNPVFINQAIASFEKAISLSGEGSSVLGVATMEKEMAKQAKGERIDSANFTTAYTTVLEASKGNWDRIATVSWWYARESILVGDFGRAKDGLRHLRAAAKQLDKHWIEYPARDVLGRFYGKARRYTYNKAEQDRFRI